MLIKLDQCPLQPWKNGLGRTRELAAQPAIDGGAGFLWRVSIAEVDSAAPFSRFPGIDRVIVLLDGTGFDMILDGRQRHALTTRHAPFAFPGEAQVEVELAAGPTRDFNLMVQRAYAGGEILVWQGADARQADPATVLVYCARGRVETSEGVLAPGDAWRPGPTVGAAVMPDADAVALAVRVVPHPR
jgi:environmental stress-induced protein Ves